MPDIRPVVALTNVNVEKMSRHDLLKWVNSTVNGQYKKVEEMCSGVAYCQMLEMLYPKSIGLKRIKTTAKTDLDYMYNLKLLQNAFTRLKFEKSIPIDRLAKGKMQDNLEFLQWFKKFHDTQSESPGVSGGADKENALLSQAIENEASAKSSNQKNFKKKVTSPSGAIGEGGQASETKSKELLTLEKDKEELETSSEGIIRETQFYYEKLTKIEEWVNEAIALNENDEFCNKVLQILYAAKEEEAVSSKAD